VSSVSESASPLSPRRQARLVFGRPRFLLVLVLAGLIASLNEGRILFAGVSDRALFGIALEGVVVQVFTFASLLFYSITALGLWAGRSWARYAALGYMLSLLAGFMLVWSPGSHGAGAAQGAILYQISAFPFLTFTIMYLWLGDRWFD
jgi:hypothetical protein